MNHKSLATAKMIVIRLADKKKFKKHIIVRKYKDFLKWRDFCRSRGYEFIYKIVY